MCTSVEQVLSSARAVVSSLDLSALSSTQVGSTFAALSELEKVVVSAKLLLAPRLAQSETWAREGARSPEEWMARKAGTSVGQAKQAMETGRKIEALPSTSDAVRAGELSLAQAAAVADAATADPSAESRLLEAAQKESIKSLQEKSRRVVLNSRGSVEERYARQRNLRSLRIWTDDEGMTAGQFRLTPDVGAAVVNRIRREQDRSYRKAYSEGRRETPENYAADAFAALVTGEGLIGAKSRSKGSEVVVVVSRDSLLRGEVDTAAGERCEVPGFGAIPVSRAKELMDDCFLKGVLIDGTKVVTVKHFGRYRPAELDTALMVRTVLEHGSMRCRVETCDRRVEEWDHRVEFAKGGETSEANLDGYCRFDHRLKGEGQLVERGGKVFRAGDASSAQRSPA